VSAQHTLRTIRTCALHSFGIAQPTPLSSHTSTTSPLYWILPMHVVMPGISETRQLLTRPSINAVAVHRNGKTFRPNHSGSSCLPIDHTDWEQWLIKLQYCEHLSRSHLLCSECCLAARLMRITACNEGKGFLSCLADYYATGTENNS
jgi:hypothetical protein